MDNGEKAEQLERDLGVRHPLKALKAGLRTRNDKEVTPFQRTTARDRILELVGKGYDKPEACIIILMRGGRVETLAVSQGHVMNRLVNETGVFTAELRQYWSTTPWRDMLIGEAQRSLNLSRRA